MPSISDSLYRRRRGIFCSKSGRVFCSLTLTLNMNSVPVSVSTIVVSWAEPAEFVFSLDTDRLVDQRVSNAMTPVACERAASQPISRSVDANASPSKPDAHPVAKRHADKSTIFRHHQA